MPAERLQEFQELPQDIVRERQSDQDELYAIWCGASGADWAWLGPDNFVDDVQPIVDELIRRVTVAPASVQIRPDNRGVTGIESLFWVDGHSNDPTSESVSAFGLTVTVTMQLTGVTWDFDDGTPPEHAGLGEAWPERSSVAHAYRDAGSHTITATLHFQPSYTVNGVAGAALAPIDIPVERTYEVRQVQAVRRR